MTLPFTGERYVPSVRGQIAYEHLHRYALAARFAAGKRVLDIASGEGYGAALLARVAAGVIGVDLDAAAVDHGRRTYYASNLRFLQGSCSELPIADGTIDVAVSFETIEHVAEHDRMLDEVRRVLAPGGVLVLSSPNKLVYSDLSGYANPFHVKELYFSELRDLLVRRFEHVHLFGQRIAALSLVHPLAGEVSPAPAWYNGAVDRLAPGLPAVGAPHYFIAVASDAELHGDLASAFIDPQDDLLEQLWNELDDLRGSLRPVAAAPAMTALGAAQPSEPADGEPQPAGADAAAAQAEASESQAQLAEAGVRHRALADEIERLRPLAAKAERLRPLVAETEPLRAQVAELEARLGEESLRARTLRASADGLSDELARARAQAQAAAAELEHESARHARTVRELSALRETATRAAAEGAQQAAALAALHGENAALRDENAALNDANGALRASAEAVAVERATAGGELAALAERLANAESTLHATAEALARAERDSLVLREVLASHSWKITYPFRRAVSLVRR